MPVVHAEPHPLAGRTVRVRLAAPLIDLKGVTAGVVELRLEDWWDRVGGGSWTAADGNAACMAYAIRSGFARPPIPVDDDVVYGKVGPYGHLVHASELLGPVGSDARAA